MKKHLFPLFAIGILIANVSLLNNPAYAVGETCKVEVIDCPGIFTGDRQVCHQNGGGLVCNCGTSTTCPEIKD